MPTGPGRLIPLLETTRLFLTNHPTLEVAARNIRAVGAGEVLDDLVSARNSVAAQKSALSALRRTRKANADKMKARLSILVRLLSTTIDPLHEYWWQFGFNKPGATSTPDVPENVEVVLVGTNALSVKWGAAARAEHYRVWKKVIGVDQELIPVGSPADLDFLLESLPANATVEIAISAVNNGGESQKSEIVQITL